MVLTTVSSTKGEDGIGPDIEQRLNDLRHISGPPRLSSIPNDFSFLPENLLGLVSWNIQVGGVTTTAGAPRPQMVQRALHRLFGGSFQVLAAQEISGSANAELLRGLLPGPSAEWTALFLDSTSTQDNGLWVRSSVAPEIFEQIFLAGGAFNGRTIPDRTRTTHPPVVAHLKVGNFDFTVINVHLTYSSGDTAAAAEFRAVLDYLDEYFREPGHDPDVIICGDFNIPTRLSGQTGRDGIVVERVFEQDPRFQLGERRLVATVHEPTTRGSLGGGGAPRNSFDHFVFSADVLEELIHARRADPEILTADQDDPEIRLTSDHFPIFALFNTAGPGVALDRPAPSPQATISKVVHGASFGDAVTEGSWMTIFGTDLASTTRTWRSDEIVQGRLPTELDGVRVAVSGRLASVFFVSPLQLNVQAPDVQGLGPLLVEVFRHEQKVAEALVQSQDAAPGLFMFDPLDRRYPATVHADGTFVGPEGLFGDVLTTRPASPGDVVLLFGTGFGPTSPHVPSGEVFAGAAPLLNPVRVLIGGIEADVLFAGLTGAGLNQLNVVIPPAVPSGDASLVVETMGVQSQEGVFLAVSGAGTSSPPPTIQASLSKQTIKAGESTTLTWSAVRAARVEIDNGIGVVPLSGSRVLTPTQTTTYTLTATGPGGTKTTTVQVTVGQAQLSIEDFSASPSSIAAGQQATLTWTTQFAEAVQIDNGVGSVPGSGSRTVSPSQTTTYTLTATGPGGPRTATAKVTVSTPQPSVQFSASPMSISTGQTAILTWSTQNATAVQIDQGIGSVSLNGSRSVTPTQTTTYRITATGSGGVSRTASVTVTVTGGGTFGPCGSKTTCGQMNSCEEAKFYLNMCQVTRLDADKDGIPCESICGGG